MEKTRCIHVAKIARKHGLTDLADSIIKNCDAFVFGEMPAESGDGDDRVSAWC